MGARGEEAKGSKAYCTLSFRVPTTSVGTRGEGQGGSRGAKGSEGYVILGFRVTTASVGARGERVMRSEGSKGERMEAKHIVY